MTMTPEPKGTLDIMTTQTLALTADGAGMVNGPEDDHWDWHAVDWRAVEGDVRRLRQRIFTASKAGDLKRVRNLQKLMLRSRANTLLSVRRVTELNAGRATAGVDGKVVLLPQAKAELVDWVQRQAASWKAKPVKRVFIPKAGNKKKRRPLGIPVVIDRVLQARVVSALEPEWEARFEPKSYGFRPGRGCHDAIEAIYQTVKGPSPQRVWALDADLVAAFDRIDHDHLLRQLGDFPGKRMIAGWLRAGVIDQGRFAPTEEGTPQGGGISPLLLNVALHGLEAAAGVRYRSTGDTPVRAVVGSPVVVRYADDLVAFCHSAEQAHEVKARLAEWLAPRGLAFNEDKTRIVHVEQTGFDFLGVNVRRYHGKLLIKPSTAALRRIRERLRAEMRALRGSNAAAVLRTMSPIVRGWSAYYRTVVSSDAFSSLDNYMWTLTYKWACHSHRNKSKHWVTARYFGAFNPSRQDKWIFGDRDTGAFLRKFSWTKIVRHQMVKDRSSPDDPALAQYWTDRRRRGPVPPLRGPDLRLLKAQDGRCPLCGDYLLHADRQPQSPEEWEQWLRVTRKAMTRNHVIVHKGPGKSDELTVRLVHIHCHRRHSADEGSGPALLPAPTPSGLA
jgi:RNA-directed DNA polymerase